MSGFLASLLGDYRAEVERLRSRPFLNAVMAACALAAAADGAPSFSERIRVDQILDTLERLKVYDPHEAVAQFDRYCARILEAPREGREEAIETVRRATGNPGTAELLIRVCLAVAEAKGEKNLTDQIEIVTLCSLLGVEPSFTGLYTEQSPDSILDPDP